MVRLLSIAGLIKPMTMSVIEVEGQLLLRLREENNFYPIMSEIETGKLSFVNSITFFGCKNYYNLYLLVEAIVIEKEDETVIAREIVFPLAVLMAVHLRHLWELRITIHMKTEFGIENGNVGWEFLVQKDTPAKGSSTWKFDCSL